MYVQPQQQQNNVAPPTEPSEELKSLKDLVRVLVINCNDKACKFLESRIREPVDLTDDFFEFFQSFTTLYLNTSKSLRRKKGTFKIMCNGNEKTVNELCDITYSWIQQRDYVDVDCIGLSDVFRDGTIIFDSYLECLVEAEIFDV